MRDDCPVEQCQFQNAQPSLLYSSALKGSPSTARSADSLTKANCPPAQQRQFGSRDKFPGEASHFQHATATPLYPTVNDSAAQISSCTSNTGTRVGLGPADPTMNGGGLVQGRSESLYLPQSLISSQLPIISRSIASGYKARWMPRWTGF
jgi:hypothetical protein